MPTWAKGTRPKLRKSTRRFLLAIRGRVQRIIPDPTRESRGKEETGGGWQLVREHLQLLKGGLQAGSSQDPRRRDQEGPGKGANPLVLARSPAGVSICVFSRPGPQLMCWRVLSSLGLQSRRFSRLVWTASEPAAEPHRPRHRAPPARLPSARASSYTNAQATFPNINGTNVILISSE